MDSDWVVPDERPLFGETLRKARKQRKLSVAKLADKVGAHKNLMLQYEHSKVMPTIGVFCKICDALDVSADALLGRIPYEDDGIYLIGEEL